MNKKFVNDNFVTRSEIEELLKQFRSDIFIRFDQIVGELAQIREDQLFMNHDIRQLKKTDEDQGKRLKKVEKRVASLN